MKKIYLLVTLFILINVFSSTSQTNNFLVAMNLRVNITAQDTNPEPVQTIIYFNPNGSDGLGMFDVPYLGGTGPGFFSYVAPNAFSINEMGAFTYDRMIRLGLIFPTNPSACRISASDNPGYLGTSTLVLEDTTLNIFHDLRANPDYNVILGSGNYFSRFKLHLGPPAQVSYTSDCFSSNIILTNNSASPVSYYVVNINQDTIFNGSNLAESSIEYEVNPGTYYVSFTRGIYSSTDTINVVLQNPIVDLGSDINQCGGTVTLNAQNPGLTYLWNTSETTQTINVSSSGSYNVSVFDSNGCSSSAFVDVTINQNPIVNLGTNINQCEGIVTLDAQNAGSTYLWNTSESTQSIGVVASGTYNVTVVDSNGCSSNSAVTVTINQNPIVDLGADIVQCGGIVPLDAQNPGLTYQWNTLETTQTINVESSGSYSVTVFDSNGCSANSVVNITINPNPVVDLGPDVNQCQGIVTLYAQTLGQSFLWNNASTNQSLTTDTSGTYFVTVFNANGCSNSDTINVYISNLSISGELLASSNIVDVADSINLSFSLSLFGNVDSIVWNFGDGSFLYDSLSVIHFFENEGLYNVTATVYSDYCSLVFETPITVSNTTATNATKLDFEVKFLENKYIEISNIDENQLVQIDVFSIDGKLVSSENQTLNQNSNTILSIANDLTPGLYLIRVKSRNLELTKKVVITRN